jgi:hypothetical protein
MREGRLHKKVRQIYEGESFQGIASDDQGIDYQEVL